MCRWSGFRSLYPMAFIIDRARRALPRVRLDSFGRGLSGITGALTQLPNAHPCSSARRTGPKLGDYDRVAPVGAPRPLHRYRDAQHRMTEQKVKAVVSPYSVFHMFARATGQSAMRDIR